MESVRIEGHKIILRGKRTSDATDDYSWRSDEELCRLDAAMVLNIPFDHFVNSHTDEISYHSPRRRRFAIDTAEGKHIGNCMYYNIDKVKKEAELGVMIGDRDYWNQGYGADAVATLLNHIFCTTNIERVYLHTLEWNVRAQQCFGKCGFVPCRKRIRYNGIFVVMEVYRDIWLNHPARKAELATKGRQEG
jgi:RimJ/RimL family protein N-acetyltransferase